MSLLNILMNDSPPLSRLLLEYMHHNGRSPHWLAQQLGVEVTAVQSWLQGQSVPTSPHIIAKIEKLLEVSQQEKERTEDRLPLTHIDNRSGGVFFEKEGDVNINGDVIGGDQTNYYPSSLPFIYRKLESVLGWTEAPQKIRQHKGKLFFWSMGHLYRAHPRFWWGVLTAVILLPLTWLYWLRPLIVTQRNIHGTALIEAGEYGQASQYLERTVALYPDDARTHYNLGNAYSLMPDNEAQAIAEFKATIRLDDRFWPAYNNLAHLQIQEDNPEDALANLQAGLRLASEMPEREKAIFEKNIGWAYLGQVGRQECPFSINTPVQTSQQATVMRALTHLEEAQTKIQTLRENGENIFFYLAEIYRLQGCAYEALGQQETANQVWGEYSYPQCQDHKSSNLSDITANQL